MAVAKAANLAGDNFLTAKKLLERLEVSISKTVKELKKPPTLALVWVGNDKQTEKFVNAKKKKATELGINFQLHHFEDIGERQLSALIASLAANKNVDGIIVQLPLPKSIASWRIVQLIPAEKDVDNLNDGPYPSPTAEGIVELLEANGVEPAKAITYILGAGKLVGAPLAEMFKKRNWPFQQISQDAKSLASEIRTGDILIAATGVEGLIGPEMINDGMVVVDGSGIDVDLAAIQDKVKLITPARGTVGPLTVMLLMRNVTEAAKRRQGNLK
jgi:methylenetetrahydrofolate dehydrogenase (NADP+)/methenyltetrahydrofolate cyclohydrolase